MANPIDFPVQNIEFMRHLRPHASLNMRDANGSCSDIPLSARDEAFSMETLESLIENAQIAKRDYIFAIEVDTAGRDFFFDGLSLCKWMSLSKEITNPFTNCEFNNLEFYIVPKYVSLAEIKRGEPALFLCDQKEYFDQKNSAFFHHLINRACPKNPDVELTECNLILDILLGRGIARNPELAFQLTKEQVRLGNRYCMMLLAFIYRKGICESRSLVNLGDAMYAQAVDRWSNKVMARIEYETMALTYNNANLNPEEEEDVAAQYRAQRLYSLV